jgi:hypothetical protein
MSPFVVFLVYIQFLLDSPNGRLPQSGFGLDLTQGIAFLKKVDDRRALSRGCWFHEMMEGGKNDCNDGNMLNLSQHGHMTLFIIPTIHHMMLKLAAVKILLMSSIGQKTVPMSNYFVQFIMKSVIIQIR